MYRMSFPAKGGLQKCPVVRCPGRVATRTAMQVHFVHWHILKTVVILEEGNLPHPQCARCDILVSWLALNRGYPSTAYSKRGAEQKRRRLAEADMWESTNRDFEACGEPIKM